MSHAMRYCSWLLVLTSFLAPYALAQGQLPRTATTATAVEEFAAALVAAKTEGERAAMLEAKKELQTPALTQALIRQGSRLRTQPDRFPPEVGPQAVAIFQLAQRLADQIGDKAGAATALSNLGSVYRNQRNQNLALEYYRKSLALYEELGDRAGMASVQLLLGFSNSARGDSTSALEHYQKSLAIHESRGDKRAMALAQNYVGQAYSLQKNYSEALKAYQQALTIFEVSADKAGMARVLNNLALVYTAQGKHDLAREAQQRILALNEELKNAGQGAAAAVAARRVLAYRILATETDEERKALLETEKALLTSDFALLLVMQTTELMQQHNYSKALPILRLAAQIAEQSGDKSALANSLMIIGDVYRGQEMTGEARECYQKSLALQERMKDLTGIAQLHIRLGWVSNLQHNYGLALWHFGKTIEVCDAIDNKLAANTALTYVGRTYIKLGHYNQALESLEQARTSFEAAKSKAGLTLTLRFLADLHLRQGDLGRARQYAEQSLMLCEEIGDKENAAERRQDLGNLERLHGHYAAAIGHYQKTITQYEALGASTRTIDALQGLAETYHQQGNHQEALRTTERAAAIARPLGLPYSSHAGRAIAGKAYLALNQPTQARLAFGEAISIIERLRAQLWGSEQEGQHFFADKISPYHEMVGLLAAQQQAAAALAYAERAKARTLLDVMRGGRGDIVKAMTTEERSQEKRLRNDLILLNAELVREQQRQHADPARLADLQARQQKARQVFETFQTGLYVAHPELKIQRGEAPILQSEEIASLLPNATTALLEYVVTGEKTFLFALTKDGAPKVYPLAIKAKELGTRAETFRRQLAKRDPEFGAAARELYDLLLKPAAAQLRGKTTLVIVPDGPLWELPFQALQPSSNRFLIEDHAISYAPSLTVLREMAKARRKASGIQSALLALGNPALGQETVSRAKYVLMDEKLDPLPEAEAQVKTLGRLYGPRQSRIYTGAEAREERAKTEAGNYRILHLATHGVLNDASPMYSHLLLAQTGEPGKEAREAQEDGLLEAWELMKLDLNADLVVLSACETARGRVGAGEGVIGLTWALFVAGCPRTVVSQWKVESASTTELMVEFHRRLKAQMQKPSAKLGAAQSLRAAALKMLRGGKYRHPFWWAGFVVVGDGF